MARRETAAVSAADRFEVVMRPVEALAPYARNARVHTDEQIALIAKSIETFGWTQPLVIDDANQLLAGHGRLLAAKLKGWAVVPCRVVSGLTDEQKRAYVLVDNEVHDQSTWDDGLLSAELADLGDAVPLLGELFDLSDALETDLSADTGPALPEATAVRDEFWITLSGPLERQAGALQLVRKSLDLWPGLNVAQGVLQHG